MFNDDILPAFCFKSLMYKIIFIFLFRIEFKWSVNKVEKRWTMGDAHLACNKPKH